MELCSSILVRGEGSKFEGDGNNLLKQFLLSTRQREMVPNKNQITLKEKSNCPTYEQELGCSSILFWEALIYIHLRFISTLVLRYSMCKCKREIKLVS